MLNMAAVCRMDQKETRVDFGNQLAWYQTQGRCVVNISYMNEVLAVVKSEFMTACTRVVVKHVKKNKCSETSLGIKLVELQSNTGDIGDGDVKDDVQVSDSAVGWMMVPFTEIRTNGKVIGFGRILGHRQNEFKYRVQK